MKNIINSGKDLRPNAAAKGERGSATVISVLILGLLTVFVALVLSRSANEARVMNNDADEGRTLYAAQASLETMTRNFNKIFEVRINPLQSDLDGVQAGTVPGFTNYNFAQTLVNSPVGSQQVLITGGEYQGLYALRDNWVLQTTATSASGAQVQLTRTFYNNRIPVFQFGIFYENDLTVHPGPSFNFGGRVHTNGNFYITPGTTAYFDSRVSTAKEIVPELARDGDAWNSQWGEGTYIKNASGAWVQLKHDMGSVRNGPDTAHNDPDVADGTINPAWAASAATFDGNLLDNVRPLYLPIRIATGDVAGSDNYRLIRRGRVAATGTTAATGGDLAPAVGGGLPVPVTTATADSLVVATERYWGKIGIRISLGDSKQRLPGCANTTGGPVTDVCGVRLDAIATNDQDTTNYSTVLSTANRGYRPIAMVGSQAYQTSRFNAYRSYTGKSYDGFARQTWIKVELINIDVTTGLPKATDITRDFLSLGFTEQAPNTTGTGANASYDIANTNDLKLTGNVTGASSTGTLTAYDYSTTSGRAATDSRAILKLQHWGIAGPQVNADATATGTTSTGNYKYLGSGTGWNVVSEYNSMADGTNELSVNGVNASNLRIGGTTTGTGGTTVTNKRLVPFPIEMWDAREGVYNADIDFNATYGADTVPINGVMSLVDIDVTNFDAFLSGNFDNKFPTTGTPFSAAKGRGLKASDVPINNGWLVYLSDRRGDLNFNGEYDMEDIFGPTDGIMQTGEDANGDGVLNVGDLGQPYTWEGTKYIADSTYTLENTFTELLNPANPTTTDRFATVNKEYGAFADHRYYRRGFRLINGSNLPGVTDLATPSNTRGFTVSAEQAIYVQGNYNATSVASQGSPTPATDYLPQVPVNGSSTAHVPASVVADQIVFLSNAWTDGNDWANPFDAGPRAASDTTYRMAVMMGSSIGRLRNGQPNQGSGDAYLDGGVHNFINMRENWGGDHLNYCGSLISLWFSRNNNGAHKTGGPVYSAPDRNWVFDVSFQDPARLPPGTPAFQYVQITGFRRTNN